MSNEELILVKGGAFSASLVTGLVSAFKTIFDFGKAVGSAIRRVFAKQFCQIS